MDKCIIVYPVCDCTHLYHMNFPTKPARLNRYVTIFTMLYDNDFHSYPQKDSRLHHQKHLIVVAGLVFLLKIRSCCSYRTMLVLALTLFAKVPIFKNR